MDCDVDPWEVVDPCVVAEVVVEWLVKVGVVELAVVLLFPEPPNGFMTTTTPAISMSTRTTTPARILEIAADLCATAGAKYKQGGLSHRR